MSNMQNMLVTLSLVGWFGIVIFELFRHRKNYVISFIIHLVLIVIAAILLNRYFGYFRTLEFKGGILISEGLLLSGLYASTVLGIVGHHVFIQIKERRQRKIRWMPVLKPLIISPIIFLAVLNQLEQISAHANSLKVIITQCILAFQNGFFWKTVLGHIWEEKTK